MPDSLAPAASAAAVLLGQAMQAHRSNDVPAARAAYEQLLALAPEHADGLHLYGVLEGQTRHHDRALELIVKAISLQPDEAMFHNNLGNVCSGAERLDEAEAHYRRAIALDPARYDAINNVAVLQGRRGEFKAAEDTFVALLAAAPGFADARQNLANLYMRGGRVKDAVEQCAIGLVTAPRNRGMRRLLGSAYGAMGLDAQATELYRKWLEEEPGNAEAAHHLAAFTGQGIPAQASGGYVRAMFDNFAKSFDAKLAELDYRAPALVAQAVTAALGPLGPLGDRAGRLRIADAGCGTGLCAPFLKPYAASLVGVDLSPPMLEKAAERGLYDALFAGELTEFLAARPAAFDLLVSADTLCYFGALEGFAAAAHASLSSGGLLVFTVEAHDEMQAPAGWRLQTHGRYSHRKDYLLRALAAAGLGAVQADAVVLRQEALQPVAGWLVSATRP